MHFLPDSPVVYAAMKVSRKAHRASPHRGVEILAPEFKKDISNFFKAKMKELEEKASK